MTEIQGKAASPRAENRPYEATAAPPATAELRLCGGSGGGYDDSDPGWDRAPTVYYYACERCGEHHEDRRPPRPWWESLWEPWYSIAEWFAERRKR